MNSLTSYLRQSIIDLDCDRAIIAKLHSNPLLINSLDCDCECNTDTQLFSIVFEEKKLSTSSIYKIVKDIPFSKLHLEFFEGKESLIIGNIHNVKQEACTNHLKHIGVEVIINQLLYNETHIWGILSFQYQIAPVYLTKDNILKPQYEKLIRGFAKDIMEGLNKYL